jgi:glycosyltransferase involved in cell wall biosynthesis
MPKLADIFVSVVYVGDEWSGQLNKKVKSLSTILRNHYSNFEVVLVDNGIRPEEMDKLRDMLTKVACVRIIRLAKQYDTDTAIFAGVEAAIGDFVCIAYGQDPLSLVPTFIKKAQHEADIVFGVARNMRRRRTIEEIGAKVFYWYSRKYLAINIPNGSTYFICMNRSAANALTRSGRFMRHIRHMAKQVGFKSINYEYDLPKEDRLYTQVKTSTLASRAIDLISNYSSHPLRILTYFGIGASILNIAYAVYVVIINFSHTHIAEGWTTLSLQSSLMFFILFIIIAVLAEYVGKILNETQQEPPYHIMQELSSTISVADETRRNVTN